MAGSLYMVSAGQTAEPTDLNQIITVLEEPSGGTEQGHYRIAQGCYAQLAVASCWVTSLSRITSPVSVAIGTGDGGPVNLYAPTAANQNEGGFLAYATCSASSGNVNCYVAGSFTIQY